MKLEKRWTVIFTSSGHFFQLMVLQTAVSGLISKSPDADISVTVTRDQLVLVLKLILFGVSTVVAELKEVNKIILYTELDERGPSHLNLPRRSLGATGGTQPC